MSNLVKMVNNIIESKKNNNEVEQASTNSLDSGLNYQFMYKQLESAIEEIMLEYPNDPVVNKLKDKVINNLKPILEMMLSNPNNNPFDQN